MSGHAYTAEGVRAPSTTRSREEPPGAARPLYAAAACAFAMAAVSAVTADLAAGRARDASLLRHLTTLSTPLISEFGGHILHLLEPTRFTLWGVALVCFALARGRRRVALVIAVLMAFAPLSAEVLKPLLSHQHDFAGRIRIGPSSFPSGHATAALTLAICAVLAAPRRWRGVVAVLGGSYVVAVGAVLLILAWHMPSDVLGGYLLATAWTALAVSCVRLAARRGPAQHAS